MSDNVLNNIPVMPLADKNAVFFPGVTFLLDVGLAPSIAAVNAALKTPNKLIAIARHKSVSDSKADTPVLEEIATIAEIKKAVKMQGGQLQIVVKGIDRARISGIRLDGHISADADLLPDLQADPEELAASAAKILAQFEQLVSQNGHGGLQQNLAYIKGSNLKPAETAYVIAASIDISLAEKVELLEERDPVARLRKIETAVGRQMAMVNVNATVQEDMSDIQRKFYLREQLKAIQKELGEEDGNIEELEERIERTPLSTEAKARLASELGKLKRSSPQHPETANIRNYIEMVLSLPWDRESPINYNIGDAQKILDSDHYGLEKVKQEILTNLVVERRLARKGLLDSARAPILCLVGPPGVGKTSLGESMAKATGRQFVSLALGAVEDVAELRGHRRTYMNSTVGAVIEKIRQGGVKNPLFMLDEVDKLMRSVVRGDPSAALLEILDPKQNHRFRDAYLDLAWDLSDVMFLVTANVMGNISQPLLNRMKVIFLGSYTEDEKMEIAKRHLIRQQKRTHGLDEDELDINDEALRSLIRHQTKESGVRELERIIGTVCDKTAWKLDVEHVPGPIRVTADNLEDYVGRQKYTYSLADEEDKVGVATGLAFTEVGGETLKIESEFREAAKGGARILTGNVKDVMKESSEVAWTVATAMARELGYERSLAAALEKNLHLHVPEGAIPKDGPSAGMAMLTTIFSRITGRPVRKDAAMTGELNLSRQALKIGGLREKLAAAARGGYTTVIIPYENQSDLDDVPEQIKNQLEIVPVRTATEYLSYALVGGNNLEAGPEERLPLPAANEDRSIQQPSPSIM